MKFQYWNSSTWITDSALDRSQTHDRAWRIAQHTSASDTLPTELSVALVFLGQQFLVYMFIGYPQGEKWPAGPPLSVYQSIQPRPSWAFYFDRFYLGQQLLVCRFMGCPQGENWPAWPPLSILQSISPPDQNLDVKNYPYDHPCRSIHPSIR